MMRTGTLVLAAVALLGSAQGAVIPRSETLASTATEITPTPTDATVESATPLPTETTEAAPTETATTTRRPQPITEMFMCLNTIGSACGKCMSDGLDGKCFMQCLTDESNRDLFAKDCPMLPIAEFMTCHDALKETCGKCTKIEGQIFGVHLLDVDEECFDTCYYANKEALRKACPAPEPVRKIVDCHEKLVEKCSACVDKDHDIDGKCLDKCFAEHKDELEVCPAKLINAVADLAQLIPDIDLDEADLELEEILLSMLSGLDLPFDIQALFDLDFDLDFEDLLDSLQQTGGNLQSAVNGFLQQLADRLTEEKDEQPGLLAALFEELFD